MKRRILSILLVAAIMVTTPTAVLAANQQQPSEQANREYHPPGYGTEYPTEGETVIFNTPVDKMTPAEEQQAGIIKPFTGPQTRATYNEYAYVTGSSDWTVYSTATGNVSKGFIGPRERVYVYNNNSNSNRYYIQFLNYGTLDTGYVSTSALRVPTVGWSRPITSGSISQDYSSSGHKAIDVAAPSGTSVNAVKNVSHSSKHMLGTVNNATRLVNFGNYISCVTNSREVIYAHLSSFTNGSVSEYSSYANEYTGTSWSETQSTWTPTAGAKIGGVGTSGWSTGNHLHFEVRSSSNYSTKYDPYQYVVFPGVGY